MSTTCTLAARRVRTLVAPYRARIAGAVVFATLVCVLCPIFLWLLSGVVSSIGFGTGVHTGLLFLLPHQAEVAAASPASAFYDLLPATLLHATGSALGEIPPFLMANHVVVTLPASMRSGVARVRPYVRTYGAWTIFAFACSPSMFFDWCGVCAGMLNIPMYKFLAATVLGKMTKSTVLLLAVVRAVEEGSAYAAALPEPGGVPLWPVTFGATTYVAWTVVQGLAREERAVKSREI